MPKKVAIQLLLILTLLVSFGVKLWARKFTLTASSKVPAASGEVDAKSDRNGNTELDLSVRNLARPGSLTPPGTAYIVWFAMEGRESPENEGQLKVDKNLKGEFKTTTPWKNFDVFVTAESDPMVKTPSGDEVLRGKVQN